MFELEKQTMSIFKDMQEEWIKVIRESEKSKSAIDLGEIMLALNDKYNQLNTKFEEAKLRIAADKKKGWFSG